MNSVQQLQQTLNAAYQNLQAGEASFALQKLNGLHKKWSQQPDVLHLKALVYKKLDNFVESETYFKRALKAQGNNPQIHNNFANLYLDHRKYAQAARYYQKALKADPGFTEAKLNWAICLSEEGDYPSAKQRLLEVLEVAPDNVSALTGLGNVSRESGDHESATQYYLSALSKNPNYVKALHNLGLNMQLVGDTEGAIERYRHALSIDPGLEASAESLAYCYKSQGRVADGVEVLKVATAHNPSSENLHVRLNEYLWELGDKEHFGQSFLKVANTEHANIALEIAYISQLIRAGDYERAHERCEYATQQFGKHPKIMGFLGQLYAERNELEQARSMFKESLRLNFDRDVAVDQIKLAIITERYDACAPLLKKLFDQNPVCQLTWALQGLVWQFLGDERAAWLNQYDAFVKPFDFQTPPGYSNLEEYLQALESTLTAEHNTTHAPLEQTLRHGTQTAAKLFDQPAKEIAELKAMLTEIVAEYVHGLESDSTHPFLNRKTDGFQFSGSWSVMLKPDGFHVNHVHPAGWISSSTYIHLPNSMSTDSDEGAIKFGESPLNLGEREEVGKMIKPKAGSVVLFPSYMWHGTIPFSGAEGDFRMTAPFDIVPT